MPDTLTILYTQNLRGDLHVLPRLYSFIQKLKARYAARPLLLDLGASCQADVWHCDATGGRSTLVVLDGMGYHAANVNDLLAAGSRQRLKNLISTAMIDAQHSWRYDIPPERDEGIIVSLQPSPAMHLNILLQATDKTRLDSRTLHLRAVRGGEIGLAQVAAIGAAPTLTHSDVLRMPAELHPAPTISAAVELVEDEARFLQKRNAQ